MNKATVSFLFKGHVLLAGYNSEKEEETAATFKCNSHSSQVG